MITRGELTYNCAESVLIKVNGVHPLPDFGVAAMKISSNLGGGVGGVGEICGAASGGAVAIALVLGTEGNESKQAFDDKRAREHILTQTLLAEFRSRFGHLACLDLLGCPGCTPQERRKRGELLKERGESRCDEYVEWVAARTVQLLED